MKDSTENKKLEFFAVTQSEFFLIVIFIILSYAIFQLGNLKLIQAESKKLRDSSQTMKGEIQALTDSTRYWQQMAILSKDQLDSLKKFTNTGIGNCLDKGFLAELSIDGEDLLSLQFLNDFHSGVIDFRQGTTKVFSKNQFAHFGQNVLNFSRSRPTECRFSIRIKDSDRVTKQQLKSVYLLCNRYFNALITK